MRQITVLYDQGCSLCCRARNWLERQTQFVQLVFVPAGSYQAKIKFPTIDHEASKVELTVIADSGEVYYDAKAWIICLWALREYRTVALTMRTPNTQWAAKKLIYSISKNRHRLAFSRNRN